MARLPSPGGDDGEWGSILNDFLNQSHASDGRLKAASVGTGQIADGCVTEAKLASDVADKLNASGGGSTTNLSVATASTMVTIASDTGSDAVIPAATTVAAGVVSATDKAKLDGIATAATANSTDATLLSRANHTGTQAISTVANLQSTLDGKVTALNGAAGLWFGTQSQYDALGTHSNTTLYVIYEA